MPFIAYPIRIECIGLDPDKVSHTMFQKWNNYKRENAANDIDAFVGSEAEAADNLYKAACKFISSWADVMDKNISAENFTLVFNTSEIKGNGAVFLGGGLQRRKNLKNVP